MKRNRAISGTIPTVPVIGKVLIACLILLAFLACPVRSRLSTIRPDFPMLQTDARGFILQDLSPKAQRVHESSYRVKELQLRGDDPQGYHQYGNWIQAAYAKGAFTAEESYVTDALAQALREKPSKVPIEPSFALALERIILKYKELDGRVVQWLHDRNGLVDVFIPRVLYRDSGMYPVRVQLPSGIWKTIESSQSVRHSVDRYVKDLEANNFAVKLYQISGGDHADIRQILMNDRALGLVGSVLIGSLPVAWYHNTNDFQGSTSDFPLDLYYMDLDGTWTDGDGDGSYDSHSGDVAPEIWVGRILGNVPITTKPEAQVIVEYLSRNHFFRVRDREHCPLQAPRIFCNVTVGLAYQDDDWDSPDFSSYLQGELTDRRVLYNDGPTTIASHYLATINSATDTQRGYFLYEHLMAHSSPTSHAFKIGDSWTGGTVSASDLNTHRRRAIFYNLFNCSGGKFTVDNFLGGMYVFANDYGLGAIASTKTGSMLDFQVYYANLSGKLRPSDSGFASDWDVVVGQKQRFGTAFLKWFRYIAKGGFTQPEINWHYGMVYMGDPTLYLDWKLNKGYSLGI